MNALESRLGSAAVLWLAAFAVVAAIIGWETDWGRSLRRAPDVAAPAASKPVAVALLPEYRIEEGGAPRKETVERPAFVPTRRPAPAAAQEAARARMQRGQFALTGTAVVDKGSIAFLRETAGGKSRSVRAGDTINGVTVAEVGRDRVKLVLGDESEELVLKVAAGPRTTIQPPVPGAPGAPGTQPVPGAVAPVPGQPPGVPPRPGQAPPVAGLQPTQAPPATDSEATLLERRRAARAAQAAAEAAARGQNAPAATPATSAPPAAPPATSGATPATSDPAWAEVYRRMQQPRR